MLEHIQTAVPASSVIQEATNMTSYPAPLFPLPSQDPRHSRKVQLQQDFSGWEQPRPCQTALTRRDKHL